MLFGLRKKEITEGKRKRELNSGQRGKERKTRK
jgi:hypothetical protein